MPISGRELVSIPLRKFPRLVIAQWHYGEFGGFHSTKEVSKVSIEEMLSFEPESFHSTKEVSKAARHLPSGIVRSVVSIPLRKFPRMRMVSPLLKRISCFHSTKEVSKAIARGLNRDGIRTFPFH